MAVKLHSLGKSRGPRGGKVLLFHCPGCGHAHPFEIECRERGWTWNGSMERPTFTPSLLCDQGTDFVCHSFVTDGRIQFLSDCHHHLAGQTVDLPDWENS